MDIQYVQTLAGQCEALCLQEVNGLDTNIDSSLMRALPGWTVLSSHCVDSDGLPYPAAGGTAILVSPSLALVALPIEEVVVPGRCMVAMFKLS